MKKLIFAIFLFVSPGYLFSNSNYLDLMKKALLNLIYQDPDVHNEFDLDKRIQGKDWPSLSHTMIGLVGLDNIQFCAEDVIKNNVPGDFIETGVWRGGAVIFMRSILKEFDIRDRTVWVADSFKGFPESNSTIYPADTLDLQIHNNYLGVSLSTVKGNFAKYGLLDNQVKFLEGLFRDTLIQAPIKKLSILRLDGDLYESTMDALEALYPKLSVGGYIIIDDYGVLNSCRLAVQDYRAKYNIFEEIQRAGWSIVYWKKLK